MRLNKGIYFGSVLVFLGLFFFRPFLGARILNFLNKPGEVGETEALVFENQNLKAEVAQLKEALKRGPENSREDFEFGFVYAHYPFNVRSEVLINIGEDKGILKDKPVLFGAYGDEEIGRSVLFGLVKEVFPKTALVETIFGSVWRSEVRIGESRVLAVLEGGATPRLRLINKDARILEGDVVYNADEKFPYGLAIGYVKKIEMSSDHLFKEAELQIPYDLAEVGLVLVLK